MLNTNVSPYYDDYNPTKDFHRILFKPGKAVQARELNQLQSIAQQQVSYFGASIYSQNSPVTGGGVTNNLDCYFIKLCYKFSINTVNVNDFVGRIVTNDTGDVQAQVLAVAAGTDVVDGSGDQPTLIVNYLSGTHFKNNDTIYTITNNVKTPRAITYPEAEDENNPCTGLASTANVADGVFFVMNGSNKAFDDNTKETVEYKTGTFVRCGKQTIILDKYSNTPSYRIGLDIEETIVTSDEDTSLYDPALESSNFEAPGADRYKIYLRLVKKPLEYGDDENFIELCKIENGIVKKQVDDDIYSTLDDYFAKRTYDTNGDFIVSDFDIEPIAYTEADWTNEDGQIDANKKAELEAKYKLKIGKGLAYVRGYRIENQSELILENDRARTTDSSKRSMFMNYGTYVKVKNGAGNIFPKGGTALTMNLYSSDNGTGAIGKANIKTVLYSNTLGDAARTKVYDLYLTDIETTSGSFNVKELVNTTKDEKDVVQMTLVDSSKASLATVGNKLSITEINYVGTIVAVESGNVFATPTIVTDASGSTYTATTANSITNVKSIGISSSAYVKVDETGMDSDGNTMLYETSNSDIILGLGNSYAKSVSYLDFDKCVVYTTSSTVAEVAGYQDGGKNFITYSTASSSLNSADKSIGINEYQMAFVRCNSFNAAPDSLRYIHATWDGDTEDNTISTTTTVGSTTSLESGNVLIRPLNNTQECFGMVYVKAIKDSHKLSNNSAFKFCLYAPHVTNFHVFKLASGQTVTSSKKVIELISASEDITSKFTLDDGQRDEYVGHAYITAQIGSINVGDSFFVLFDAIVPDASQTTNKTGYYSIKSYEDSGYGLYGNIYDLSYTSTTGATYKLSDSLDFRPRISLGDTTAITSIFYSNGLVQDDESVTCMYEYYLGRHDILVLSKDNSFQIIQGAPALNPKTPETPSGCLLIATIIHDPYTYYLPEEAPRGVKPNLRIIKNIARRWTMNDISVLDKRIDNIEYYTALNMLEQTAQNMQITDADGLNRFKNGILVDNFTSYLVADTKNAEYSASIDKINGRMSIAYDVDNFVLVDQGKRATNVAKMEVNTSTNNYLLPYHKVTVAEQQLASNTVNVNPFGVSVYQGSMSINPSMDNWVDNTKEPDITIVDEGVAFYGPSDELNVLSVTNWQTIPGTSRSNTQQVSSNTTSSTSTSRTFTRKSYKGYDTTTTTTTTNTTYKTTTTTDQSRQITSGYYSYIGDSYRNENGFITDISIKPYIREQDLLIYAEGMASNAKVSCWFDGVNVDDYFKMADVIELEYSANIIGFKRGDLVGYQKSSTSIYPIGTVVGTYFNEADNIARLYVISSYLTTVIVNDDITIVPIEDNGGTWSVTNTEIYGKCTSGKVISDSYSGRVVSVGRIDDYNTSSTKTLFNQVIAENSTFLQRYGVFGNYTGSSKDGFKHRFEFKPTEALTIYPCYQSTLVGTIRIYKSTTLIKTYPIALSSIYTVADDSEKISLDANTTYRIEVDVTKVGTETLNNQIAVAFSTESWSLSGTTNGDIVWSTKTPLLSTVSSATNFFGGNTYVAGGGIIYSNVRQIVIGGSLESMNVENYYSGAKVTITSYGVDVNGGLVKLKPQTVVIDSFDKDTGIATLTEGVTVSFGYNNKQSLDITASYNIQGSTTYKLSSNKVAGISTNEDGVIVGVFSIPADTFKTGERKFRIDNRTTDQDPGSATTYSEGTFMATGLSTKSQSLSFSASIDSMANTTITTETRTIKNVSYSTDSKTTSSSYRTYFNFDPLAQTFMVNSEEFPNGCFLSGIKVFFQSKPTDTNTPITCRIVTTDTGYPTTTELDNSIVTLTADKVNVSQEPYSKDPNTYTTFEFQTPVYIQPDVLYAYVLKSDSTDYNVWIAKQNNIALPSSLGITDTDVVTKIGNVPYIGNIFESQNAATWVADPTASMMFIIERCVFDNSRTPMISFGIPKGNPQRKSLLNDSNNLYTNYRENDSYECDALNFTTTEFVPSGTLINYEYVASSVTAKIGGRINPGNYGCPTYNNVVLDDGYGPRTINTNDDSSLVVTATLSSDSDAISPVLCDDGLTVYNIRYRQDEDGKAKGVYITQKATLASGNTSEDILIYLTGYRPVGTEINVFVKMLSPDDSALFDENPWVELERLGEVNNFSQDTDDVIELNYAFGKDGVAYNNISYTSANGQTYGNFYQFAVKIELTTNDNTKIPFVDSLIAIALPDGN